MMGELMGGAGVSDDEEVVLDDPRAGRGMPPPDLNTSDLSVISVQLQDYELRLSAHIYSGKI